MKYYAIRVRKGDTDFVEHLLSVLSIVDFKAVEAENNKYISNLFAKRKKYNRRSKTEDLDQSNIFDAIENINRIRDELTLN